MDGHERDVDPRFFRTASEPDLAARRELDSEESSDEDVAASPDASESAFPGETELNLARTGERRSDDPESLAIAQAGAGELRRDEGVSPLLLESFISPASPSLPVSSERSGKQGFTRRSSSRARVPQMDQFSADESPRRRNRNAAVSFSEYIEVESGHGHGRTRMPFHSSTGAGGLPSPGSSSQFAATASLPTPNVADLGHASPNTMNFGAAMSLPLPADASEDMIRSPDMSRQGSRHGQRPMPSPIPGRSQKDQLGSGPAGSDTQRSDHNTTGDFTSDWEAERASTGAGIDDMGDPESNRNSGAMENSNPAFGFNQERNLNGGFGARSHSLPCIEILEDGSKSVRIMSRSDVLQEARSTLPKNAPTPHDVAQMLRRPEERSEELREFGVRYGPGREASHRDMQRALRYYLRHSLQPRDIRQVDPAFTAKPALWVRHSALVVSIEHVRAIVLHDKVFLFDLEKPKVQRAASIIQRTIQSEPDVLEDIEMPFEFKALEGIFVASIMALDREFQHYLTPKISGHLRELPDKLTTQGLEELRANKQLLNHFLSRANNARDVLEKLLDEDEDMANMYLTEKHRNPTVSRADVDHDEVEMLLETYMQVMDELVSHAELLNDQIDDTEDLVMIHLDTLRNRLLSVELVLSVVSMTFGFGGMLAGIFGMNLSIPLFADSASRFWFLGVVIVIIAFTVVVSWLMLLALKRRGLYSLRLPSSE